ncbi:MAG: class I SAM-dependent methyltransferase [Anaerolineae bacterium]|jgi:SAM-dependent methyltransferase|nr:class I SAM-dependent methyltransferase [Anaerolineae bacterium]
MISQHKPTERFSTKVENYARYRPHYPPEVLELLRRECGLTPDWTIADIGSGTAISSELFVANGNRVFGVEPNAAMRAAGDAHMTAYPNFVSVAATAEETTLPDASVEMALAGQAFHWFEQERARREFVRILKPGGWLVPMWNSRDEASAFQQDYERFVLEFGTDYTEIRHQNVTPEALAAFFAPAEMRAAQFKQAQVVDWEGLAGRVLSSSYMPASDHPRYEAMLAELRRLFDAHAVDGKLPLDLVTQVYYGRLT